MAKKKLKIGMMSAWNSDSGASIHAEFIGREWVKMGHKLTVFSFIKERFHGTALVQKDEPYIKRCFSTHKEPVTFDPIPFLTADYDFFIAQDIGMFPKNHFGKIFHWIKKKSKTVTVIHDGKLTDNPDFYQFPWDGVVGFDPRYINFLNEGYPKEIVKYIPYPCFPWKPGNKGRARQKLKLPKDKKIIFMFGPAAGSGSETFPWLLDLKKEYPIHVVIVCAHSPTLEKIRPFYDLVKNFTTLRQKVLTIDEVYDYLYASDVMIFNKRSLSHVAVSSTVFQCLGSGCPIVSRDSNFVDFLDKAVLKYTKKSEFDAHIRSAFDEDQKYKKLIKGIQGYLDKNDANKVAQQFIDYFNKLKTQK